MITHLSESLLPLDWAKGEITNFDTAAAIFLETQPNKLVIRPTAKEGTFLLVAKQVQMASDDMRRTAYRVVSDLRNALDQATHQALVALDTKLPDKTNFPLGDSKTYVERQLAARDGPYRGIPIQLHRKLLSFKPYFGDGDSQDGDLILRVLGQLANPNKHRLPLRTITNFGTLGIRYVNNVDLFFDQPGRIIAEDEIEILQMTPTAPDYQLKADVKYKIGIGGNDLIATRSAVEVFNAMAQRVESIITELDAEVVALLS